MFIAFNLRRIANILTPNVLKEYLRILLSSFLSVLELITGKIVITEGICFSVSGWTKNHYGLSQHKDLPHDQTR
jgi:hypothetical protein